MLRSTSDELDEVSVPLLFSIRCDVAQHAVPAGDQ